MVKNVMNTSIETNMRSLTRFSVLMCVYYNDNPEHFRLALESIINQTRMPDEIVLVVDGPISESLNAVVENYESMPFFKVIRLSKNVGHGNARRIGFENCSNELIALMDADDISVPSRFEKQLKCFEQNTSLSVVGGNIIEFIGSIENTVGMREVPKDDIDIKKYLKKRCPFNQVTVMLKRKDVEVAGGYVDWHYEEDYYLWIRMYQQGAIFMNLEDSLVYVRVGNEMYRRRGGLKYFKSEFLIQKYLLNQRIINFFTFLYNVGVRFIIQVLMPNKLRGIVFRKLARKKINNNNCNN